MADRHFTCIVCPRGCRITVDDDMNITGNFCKRGIEYVKTELTAPKRIVTSTIKTVFPDLPRVSVKTDKPIPKESIYKIMDIINAYVLDKHADIGEILIKNIMGTNANIVLTKPCLK